MQFFGRGGQNLVWTNSILKCFISILKVSIYGLCIWTVKDKLTLEIGSHLKELLTNFSKKWSVSS